MSRRSSAVEESSVEPIKEELVRFDNVKASYYTEAPRVTLTYTLVSNTPYTPHDWIGLFPLHWRETSDPLAFTSAPPKSKSKKRKKRGGNEDRRQVDFPLKDATANIVTDSKNHWYQFVYVSKGGKVFGQSRAFSIQGEELWNLEDDDEEFSRLSSLQSSPTTVLHDSEISILSRSQATNTTCLSESPVLLSYPSDLESEGGDVTNHEDWDITHAASEDKVRGDNSKAVSETALSEFSDIEILSTSPSKDDYSLGRYSNGSVGGGGGGGGCGGCGVDDGVGSCGSSPVNVYPEDDFTLCDIKIQGSRFGVLEDEDKTLKDGVHDDDDDDDASDKSFTRKSKKNKKNKSEKQINKVAENSDSDTAKDFDKLEDREEKSQVSIGDCSKKLSKKEEKKRKRMEAELDNTGGDISECETLSKSLSGKTKKKKESKENSCEKNIGERADERKGKGEVINKTDSKKSRKEKKSIEKVSVKVERIPTPTISHQTISQTVAEQLKFLEVEDDVQSIRLSDVDDDEEGKKLVVEEPISTMSRKEKRKLRKMKEKGEKTGGVGSSANNKLLIVELDDAKEEKVKSNSVNKGEAQEEDRITADIPTPNDVITRQETVRAKKRKRKNSDKAEVDTESIPANISRESNTSAIGSHDKSTRGPSVNATSLAARDDNKNTPDPCKESTTTTIITTTTTPTKNAKQKSSSAVADNSKNISSCKKVPKDKNGGMLVYFETVPTAPSADHGIESTSKNELQADPLSQNVGKSDQREAETCDNVPSKQTKYSKKSKRMSKDQQGESSNVSKIEEGEHELMKEKSTLKTKSESTESHDKSESKEIESVVSGKSSKRSKQSKGSSKDNSGDVGEEINNLVEKEVESNKSATTANTLDSDVLRQSSKSNRKSKGCSQNDIKEHENADAPIKLSHEKAEKESVTQTDTQSTEKSKYKTRKIPKTNIAVEAARDSDALCAAVGCDTKKDKMKKKTKTSSRVSEEVQTVETEYKRDEDEDILNNNLIDITSQAKALKEKNADNGRKKGRKSKNETQQHEEKDKECTVGSVARDEETESQTSHNKKSKSKEIKRKVSIVEKSTEGTVIEECKEISEKTAAHPATKGDLNTHAIENAFSGSGINEPKTKGMKEETKINTPIENTNKSLKRDKKKLQDKVKNVEENLTDKNKKQNESKRVSFISDNENQQNEDIKESKTCNSPKKSMKSLVEESEDVSWSVNENKENIKTAMRNKLYLAKKEKMRAAAIKAKSIRKERRSKGKSEMVIMLKDLFEEPFTSMPCTIGKLTMSHGASTESGYTGIADKAPPSNDRGKTSSSNKTLTPSTMASASIKRPQIPAYLLDVMDDLPEDPDTPDFREWRKAMAHGKGKGRSRESAVVSKDDQIADQSKGDVTTKTTYKKSARKLEGVATLKGRDRGSDVKANVLPPSPLATITTDPIDNDDGGDDYDEDVGDVEMKDEDGATASKNTKKTTGMSLMMSYASVLKGMPTRTRNAKIEESSSSSTSGWSEQNPSTSGKATHKSLTTKHRKRGHHQEQQKQQRADDKKILIRARRSIFSPGYKNLYHAAMETQCYLLDKVENRLVGRHPQFSRRAKLRTARKIKMNKENRKKLIQTRLQRRTQKEDLNGEMLSNALVPIGTSLVCEPAGSFSLVSNESNESIESVSWPLPAQPLAITAYENESESRNNDDNNMAVSTFRDSMQYQPCFNAWKISEEDDVSGVMCDDVIHQLESSGTSGCFGARKEMITMNGDDECLGFICDDDDDISSMTGDEDNDIIKQIEAGWVPPKMADFRDSLMTDVGWGRRGHGTKGTVPCCLKGNNPRFPGYPKSLGLAYTVLQRLRSEVKVKDKEIACLENQVTCLKEVIKKQSRQETKTSFKLVSVKRKYNLLKAARIGQNVPVLEPEMPRSMRDDLEKQTVEKKEKTVQEPPCKKRKLEYGVQVTDDARCAVAMSNAEDEEEKGEKTSSPLDLRKDAGRKIPTVQSPRLYPDIQRELCDLQKEVNKYSEEHSNPEHQQRHGFMFRQYPSISLEESSLVFSNPVPIVPTNTGEWGSALNHQRSPNSFHFTGTKSIPSDGSGIKYQSQGIPPSSKFQNPSVQTCMTHVEFLQQQQQKQQQQSQQFQFGTRPISLQQTSLPQPQFAHPTQFNFPAVSPIPYPTSTRNNCTHLQLSPQKPALLPTPPPPSLQPPLSSQQSPPTIQPNPANPNQIPQLPNSQQQHQPPLSNPNKPPRGFSCPPYQRSRSPTVFYHQTSPIRKREQTMNPQPMQRQKNSFGCHRYTPLTRPNPHPATVVVAPRPRHFNRPFPCNDFHPCQYPLPIVYDRPQRECYTEFNRAGSYNQYNDDHLTSPEIPEQPLNHQMYFIPENATPQYLPQPPRYFSFGDEQTVPRCSSNYCTATPNSYSHQDTASSSYCLSRQDCHNCCHNHYNLAYQH